MKLPSENDPCIKCGKKIWVIDYLCAECWGTKDTHPSPPPAVDAASEQPKLQRWQPELIPNDLGGSVIMCALEAGEYVLYTAAQAELASRDARIAELERELIKYRNLNIGLADQLKPLVESLGEMISMLASLAPHWSNSATVQRAERLVRENTIYPRP